MVRESGTGTTVLSALDEDSELGHDRIQHALSKQEDRDRCCKRDEVCVTFVLLVPLFLLVAATIVLVGSDRTRHARAKLAAYPVGIACLGAVGTLYQVASSGPIEIRFYNLSSVASFAIP